LDPRDHRPGDVPDTVWARRLRDIVGKEGGTDRTIESDVNLNGNITLDKILALTDIQKKGRKQEQFKHKAV
jgi:hypothetical protein